MMTGSSSETPPEQGSSPQPSQNGLPPETRTSTPGTERSSVPVTKQLWFIPALVGVGALVIGLIGGLALGIAIGAATSRALHDNNEAAAAGDVEGAKEDLFVAAAKRCNVSAKVEIADGGRTMIVDGEGEEAFTGDVTFGALDCIIEQVGTPRSTKQLMLETRSLDGRQSDSWDADGVEIEASWSYHPDDGLDIIFEIVT